MHWLCKTCRLIPWTAAGCKCPDCEEINMNAEHSRCSRCARQQNKCAYCDEKINEVFGKSKK